MAWQKLSEFLNNFSEASRPQKRTVINWIENGDLYGKRFGNIYYVDPDQVPGIAKKPAESTEHLSPAALELVQAANS